MDRWAGVVSRLSPRGSRSTRGEVAIYPLNGNVHAGGILRLTRAPFGPPALQHHNLRGAGVGIALLGSLLAVFGMSSIPDLKPPAAGVPGVDKLFHAGEYAMLGWLWGRARGRAGAGFLRGALLGLGVGVMDELYQGSVPGREVDLFDVAAGPGVPTW